MLDMSMPMGRATDASEDNVGARRGMLGRLRARGDCLDWRRQTFLSKSLDKRFDKAYLTNMSKAQAQAQAQEIKHERRMALAVATDAYSDALHSGATRKELARLRKIVEDARIRLAQLG